MSGRARRVLLLKITHNQRKENYFVATGAAVVSHLVDEEAPAPSYNTQHTLHSALCTVVR